MEGLEVHDPDLEAAIAMIAPGRSAEGMIDIDTVKWWRFYGGDNLL